MAKITDFKLRPLPEALRTELFSYVPRKRVVGMSPEDLMDVMDAYGRSDLAVSALREMGLPAELPTGEAGEAASVTMLKVIVTDESYRSLYERDVEDRFRRSQRSRRRGELSKEAARELFGELFDMFG